MTTLKLIDAEWTEHNIRMRLPFQFGNTEVWSAPEAYLSIRIEVDGTVAVGHAAQLMVPRWFNKSTTLSNEDTVDELKKVLRTTVDAVPNRTGSAYEISRALRQDVANSLPMVPALAAGFGPALVEMAMIDALCVAQEVPFWVAARDDLFGIASCFTGAKQAQVQKSLSQITAPSWLALRHTVGFDAPLRDEDCGADAPQDGLPVSLEDVIARTGISAFKIKLKGDPDTDLARLRAIDSVIGGLSELSLSLDANEQYAPDAFDAFLSGYQNDKSLDRMVRATRFVEQPFAREIALDTPVETPIPLLIDESDDHENSFERALSMGWSGTSIKSCKGVLRALANKTHAEEAGAILSGEDLTCQPGLCWQQDMAMMAACAVRDVERNGDHFAGGMQGANPEEREVFLRHHPDIYRKNGKRISLDIRNGGVEIASLGRPGFGHFSETQR